MVITKWIIQINFFTGCLIISLVPAGYVNLISGMWCCYYINAARSRSEDIFILPYCSKLKLSWLNFFNCHLFSSVSYSARDTWNFTSDFSCHVFYFNQLILRVIKHFSCSKALWKNYKRPKLDGHKLHDFFHSSHW